jgi:hypothetical protein
VFVFLPACSVQASKPSDLPSFADVEAAPAIIQSAAKAVVRINTAGESATGSFISPSGILLTNNHVLGVPVCPVEGCYATLTFMYQRGLTPEVPETVFVVPLAVDTGLDMAVLQTYFGRPGGAPLVISDYLTIDSRSAPSLIGEHLNVVGHPEGHLKQWTQGVVTDSNGTWIYASAYILPGSSGSPFLDDDGHLVGIVHRVPTEQDLITRQGVDEYSLGTASSALIAAMSAPLPPTLWSIAQNATDDEVAQNDIVYLNAHAATATVAGASKPVLTSLGAACDAALAQGDFASPEDLASALQPCTDAELWIDCRGVPADVFAVCPSDISAWQQRYQGVYDHWVALNGELSLNEVSYAQAALSSTTASGLTAGANALQQALAAANAPLDFNVASYLAAFQIDSYNGTSLSAFVGAYASYPDYPLWATSIAGTAISLSQSGDMSGSEVISLLEALAADPNVDVASSLYIEDVLYQSNALQ